MNLGHTIAELRERKGLKQKTLAEKCHITQAYLSQIENNKRYPNISTLNVIGSTLEIPVPIIFFLSIDEHDFTEKSRKLFEQINPIIKNLVDDVFLTTNGK